MLSRIMFKSIVSAVLPVVIVLQSTHLSATNSADFHPEVNETRIATFNASLNRGEEGQLITDLAGPGNDQAQAVAEIIQRTRPDVILINEFDYDAEGKAAALFQANYLSVGQNGAESIEYPYVFLAPSNTGVASGKDLNNDGVIGESGLPYANDAFGFGTFPGQYGMLLLSKHPIDKYRARTFRNFVWSKMPGALLPDNPETPEPSDWFSPDELEIVRLSSKSHWDVPVLINGKRVHILASHPTPPVFDGPEDRNGKRNHDEIRFWADYISGFRKSYYIQDDAGRRGGLRHRSRFVIMGDQNADPFDGDSTGNPMNMLSEHSYVNSKRTPMSAGSVDAAFTQGEANRLQIGNRAQDTADFSDSNPGNLRVDYVLPSYNLRINDSGVFWPASDDELYRLVGEGGSVSSDHRLVWVDVTIR